MNKNIPILEIKNLKASINENEILKNLDLTVNKGEIHAIMGTKWLWKKYLFKSISRTSYLYCNEVEKSIYKVKILLI